MAKKPKNPKVPIGIDPDWERIRVESLSQLPCNCSACLMRYKAVFYSAARAFLVGLGQAIEGRTLAEYVNAQIDSVNRFDDEFSAFMTSEAEATISDAADTLRSVTPPTKTRH